MASMIGLTNSSGNKVIVNADQIAFMAQSDKHENLTVIKMVSGDYLHVREEAYAIAYRIVSDPSDIEPPDDETNSIIATITSVIIHGNLIVGEQVEIQSIIEYACGDAEVNRLQGTYAGSRGSTHPGSEGVTYHHFTDVSVNGNKQGAFGIPADSFIN